MDLRWGLIIALVCLIIVSPVASAEFTTSVDRPQHGVSTSVSGVSVEMQPKNERVKLEKVRSALEPLGVSVPDQMFYLFYEDGAPFVLTSKDPETGAAQVTGTRISASEIPGIDTAVIIADDVQFSTEGKRVDWQTVRDHPQQYSFEIVQVTVTVRQGSFISESDPRTVIGRARVAKIGKGDEWTVTRPGERARGRLRTIAQSNQKPLNKLGSQLGEGTAAVDYHGTAFWLRGRARLDIGVIYSGNQLYLFLADSEPVATAVSSVKAVNSRDYTGKTVQFKANVLGARISVQELLLETAKCAPQSVTFPGAGCVPLPVDATIHTGVAYQIEDGVSVVPYAGVSNRRQTKPVTLDQGSYRLAGRVVSTNKLHPKLPKQPGVILFEQHRTGDQRQSAPSQAKERAKQMRQAMSASARGEEPSFAHRTSASSDRLTETATSTDSREQATSTPVGNRQRASAVVNRDTAKYPFGGFSSGIGILAGFVAIVCWISAILLIVLRWVQTRRGYTVEYSEGIEGLLQVVGTLSASLTLLSFGQVRIAALVSALVFGFAGVLFGSERYGRILADKPSQVGPWQAILFVGLLMVYVGFVTGVFLRPILLPVSAGLIGIGYWYNRIVANWCQKLADHEAHILYWKVILWGSAVILASVLALLFTL